METFNEFLKKIDDQQHLTRVKDILDWVSNNYPDLEPKYAWNQPMFTNHGTFIIGFSVAKHHIAISPEQKGMEKFKIDIAKSGYAQSKMLFRIKWDEPIDYSLLDKIIKFNCQDKAGCTTFWRK